MDLLKKIKDSIIKKTGVYIAFYLIFISTFLGTKNSSGFFKIMPVFRCIFVLISFFIVFAVYKNLKLNEAEKKRIKGSVVALLVLEIISIMLIFGLK